MDFKKYLTEAAAKPEKHVVVVNGRYNPTTVGHMKLFNRAAEIARERGAELHIITSHSEGNAKNPLPQDKKIEYLKKVVPKGAKVYGTSKQAPTVFHSLADLHSKGFTHVTMVSDAPRTEEYSKTIPKYNGVEGRHGLYDFKKINFESAGERDPNSSDIEGVSATKAREHALAGRHDEFKSMLPAALHPHAKEMANYIKLANESTDYMRIRKEKTIPILFKNYNDFQINEVSELQVPEVDDDSVDAVDKHDLVTNIKDEMHKDAAMKAKRLMQFKYYVESTEVEKESDIINEEEVDKIADSLRWEDIVDLYTDEELVEEDEEMNESLSLQARIKKKQTFARFRSRRGVAKKLKLQRASDMSTLQRRSKMAARRALYKRFLKGRDKSQLSASEKDRIEKQVASLKVIQSTLAQKMMPKIRSIEQKRLAKARTKKR